MLTPRQDQVLAKEAVQALIAGGERRILLQSPTGAGKSLIAALLLKDWLDAGLSCAVYTNRRLLIDQLREQLADFDFGVRAAGHASKRGAKLQIVSTQTEASRSGLRKAKCKGCGAPLAPGEYLCFCGEVRPFDSHLAQRNVIDEAHLQAAAQMQQIMDAGEAQGGVYVGLTATPLGLGEVYRKMVVAATPSQLRAVGALVPAVHYGPDEPDLKGLGRLAQGEDLTEKQATSAMMRDGLFGRVLEWFLKLNPQQRPSILFAPGVPESLWFAEQFQFPHLREERWQHLPAVPAAHIDGDEVWMNGTFRRSSPDARAELIQASRSGEVRVVCNRFVLREGVDLPWVRFIVNATVFGSLQTYLQSNGRGLRADRYEDTIARWGPKDEVVIIDHGGNCIRHGSLNADRAWELAYTNIVVAGLRADRLRSRKCQKCSGSCCGPVCPRCGAAHEVEPERCPECARIIAGKRCPCGFVLPGHRSRVVVQSDGTLKQVCGDVFHPLRVYDRPGGEKRWEKVYWRARNSKTRLTFKQAFGWFAKQNQWGWPDLAWPYMPADPLDHFKPVATVPYARLVPNPDLERNRHDPETSLRGRPGPGDDSAGDGLFG